MILFREKKFLLMACLLTLLCFMLAAFVGVRRVEMAYELTKHGFDRAVVIAPGVKKNRILTAVEAARSQINTVSMLDGPLAVVSRDGALKLSAMPEIESMMAITKSDKKLSVDDGLTSDVTIFNVPTQFITQFHLGDPLLLGGETYVPSKAFQQKLANGTSSRRATLGISDSVASLINAGDQKVDLSNYKLAVVLSAQAFDLPGGSTAFDYTLFATGEPAKIEVPNTTMSVKVWLVAKVKGGVDSTATFQKLADIVEMDAGANGERNLVLLPMTQFLSKQLSVAYLDIWATRLLQGVFAVSTLLLLMLVLTRQLRLKREVSLRQATGASKLAAVWLSSRTTMAAVLAGIGLGSVLAMATCFAVQKPVLVTLYPMLGAMAGVGALSVLIVFLGSMLATRVPLAMQLKGSW